ncbi:hypothetical protein ANN_14944 [Periplaneta americana]|uniref:Uncharacterized protein n=1 Tax=Periplaneta americana TaxID=6978 RepID=A0ABQ8SXN4_PERAM|nr:hypothetical protein ANN_14944 [Periplaneta americana]
MVSSSEERGRSHWVTKEQSKQWKHVDSPPAKKAKTQPSSGKVMLSVFLGHPRCGADRLCSEGANHHRSILPKSPDEVTGGYQDEASREAVQGEPFCFMTTPQLILHRTQSHMLLL